MEKYYLNMKYFKEMAHIRDLYLIDHFAKDFVSSSKLFISSDALDRFCGNHDPLPHLLQFLIDLDHLSVPLFSSPNTRNNYDDNNIKNYNLNTIIENNITNNITNNDNDINDYDNDYDDLQQRRYL